MKLSRTLLLGLAATLVSAPQSVAAPQAPTDTPPPASGGAQPPTTAPPPRRAARWEPRPCLIQWQRTLDDAEAHAKRTGKPLLVCVNMDGEPASEVFANRKYGDPAFAALVDCFVPVIVSPNRHTERDYDGAGRRVLCPRFGTVTCGEHLALDAPAFERYFRGQRVAPRHVGVGLTESGPDFLFDRYLDQDLSVVDAAMQDAVGPHCGRPWIALFERRDATARAELEKLYNEGSRHLRAQILSAAADATNEPFDLLLRGLHEPDKGLRRLARQGLAATASDTDVARLQESLGKSPSDSVRKELFPTLEALAPRLASAKRLVEEKRAVEGASLVIDVPAWQKALSGNAPAAESALDQDELFELVDQLGREVHTKPADVALNLKLADTLVTLAQMRMDEGHDPTSLALDAGLHAVRAVDAGADPVQPAAVRARAAWILNDVPSALEQAQVAAPKWLEHASSNTAYHLLKILARASTQLIYDAKIARVEWPVQWLADAHAAWTIAALHPSGSAADAMAHADLLDYIGLSESAENALQTALTQYPKSVELHQRYRSAVEKRGTVAGLERAYQRLIEDKPHDASLRWFAGYAELIVAEDKQRKGQLGASVTDAYERAVRLFEVSIALEEEYEDSAAHYVSIARAGQAKLAFDAGDRPTAASRIIEAILRRPESLESEDGLSRTARGTLTALRREIAKAGEADLERQLREILEPLIPDVWDETAP